MKAITQTGFELDIDIAVTPDDADDIASLLVERTPDMSIAETAARVRHELRKKSSRFLLGRHAGAPVCCAQISFRHEYVEGTSSSPVAYVESLIVGDRYRGKGCSSITIRACERYALACGCSEIATDCIYDDLDSRQFLNGVGFTEANTITCFVKSLGKRNGGSMSSPDKKTNRLCHDKHRSGDGASQDTGTIGADALGNVQTGVLFKSDDLNKLL